MQSKNRFRIGLVLLGLGFIGFACVSPAIAEDYTFREIASTASDNFTGFWNLPIRRQCYRFCSFHLGYQ